MVGWRSGGSRLVAKGEDGRAADALHAITACNHCMQSLHAITAHLHFGRPHKLNNCAGIAVGDDSVVRLQCGRRLQWRERKWRERSALEG